MPDQTPEPISVERLYAIAPTQVADEVVLLRDRVRTLTEENERLRANADPTTWTAPNGTVFDLTKPVYDRDGDEWVHDRSPWSTMAMTDGDLGPRLLGDLFEQYSPLTQEPPKDGAR